jgi:hypothetical protein
MPDNPTAVGEALALLREKRDALLADVEHVQAAIAALEKLSGTPGATGSTPRDADRPSVRTMAVDLMNEDDRDWSVAEILTEYKDRGTPVHGKDPKNALRAALADAKKRGLIASTAPGRYRSARWFVPPEVPRDTQMDQLLRRNADQEEVRVTS